MMAVLLLKLAFVVASVLMIGYIDAQDRIIFRADDENVADEYSPKNVKIPEKILIQMKDIQDATEFLSKFVQTYDIVGRRPMKSAPMPTIARPATCEPEEQVVELERPGNGALYLWPPCVRVRRCGGCCTSKMLTCSPIATSLYNVTVLQVLYNPQKPDSFENQGTNVFSLEQHDRCSCKCKQNASSCSSRQRFREDECRCACINQEESARCIGPKRIWDTSDCTCKCRKILDCSTGSFFNPLKCRCETGRRSMTVSSSNSNRRFLISN
ncbi:unnamed protein product [Larinioides sclopetarius]|uniref:Platelet-derived growth factor (PDGF) family profile domain-containing protein n=1 Tax=Larinioides sclopetarius TaxID=280406 RepID=A0AAV2BET3_9ARAC